ncbi:MAG: tetratricopeptide repeat protein, partial [Bdellovibrionota bacterium]|nr:tetratricopeptide repeat protein [Bdellovibrionota bacterium]
EGIEQEVLSNKEEPFDFYERAKRVSNFNEELHESNSYHKNKIEKDSEYGLKNRKSEKKEDESIVTLTLVDLYLSQGHKDKALDVLEKLISLNPSDKTLKAKRQGMEFRFESKSDIEAEEHPENPRDDKNFLMVKGRMNSFLNELKKRAESFKEA